MQQTLGEPLLEGLAHDNLAVARRICLSVVKEIDTVLERDSHALVRGVLVGGAPVRGPGANADGRHLQSRPTCRV